MSDEIDIQSLKFDLIDYFTTAALEASRTALEEVEKGLITIK